jgi:hypothetical protein
MLFLGVSLLLNTYLATHLVNRKAASPAAAETADDSKPAEPQPPSAALATPETPAAMNPNVPTFQWCEIESSDYRQYIANLRAVGCPEQVIHDIIVADVGQLFNKRARDIWQPRVPAYWQKSAHEQPTSKQAKQLMALDKEHGMVLQDLLGVRVGRQELINTLYLQVERNEAQLLFLPVDRREAALRALADADLESKEKRLLSQANYSTQDEQKLFNEKLDLLANALSPEELEEFHQRNSPTGLMLKLQVRYFNLTPDEYKQLLLAKESSGGSQETRDLVQKLFGDERAKEFEHVSSAFYFNARQSAEAEGISLDRVDQAATLADDSMKQAFATVQDKTLPVEERRARLKELEAQAESKIKDLLGEKASRALRRDLRNALRSSASHMQP